MLTKDSDFIIYRDERLHAAFPSVITFENGEILIAFRRARDHRWLLKSAAGEFDPDLNRVDHVDPRSQIALIRLNRYLEPLGPAVGLPVDPEAGDQDGNLLLLRSGRILQYSFMWYPLTPGYGDIVKSWGGGFYGARDSTGMIYLHWGCYVRFSDDNGQNWSPRTLMPPLDGVPDRIPDQRKTYGIAIRGRAAELPDGTILLASYHGHPQSRRSVSAIHRSRDGGESWENIGPTVAELPDNAGLCEPALAATADGQLMAFHRTYNYGDRLVTLKSADGGETWGGLTSHNLIGHPHDPLVLPDGRIFLVYGYRHDPAGIRARLIDPDMADFGEAEELIIRDDGPTKDLGYPWATLLPDGRILVVYYICDNEGVRHIAGSVLRWD